MLFVSVSCAILTVFLSSCSTSSPRSARISTVRGSMFETQFSIVCFIHGDGEYLYHDTSGNEYEADEEALAVQKKSHSKIPTLKYSSFTKDQGNTSCYFFLFEMENFIIIETDGLSQMNHTGAIRKNQTSILKWDCIAASERTIGARC